MEALGWTVLSAYFILLSWLALYGLHRFALLRMYRGNPPPAAPPAAEPERWPTVTVQLPVFNEACVVERLLRAAAALEYPRERLEIQVLDDSTDETRRIARETCSALARGGLAIRHLRRGTRSGYKAGALAFGHSLARGELLLVFDADFVPAPDFLRRTVPLFLAPGAGRLGMVQARWGHLNEEQSSLTRSQALLLDGHFVIEHAARNRSGRFFNFNGTAGIWRRAAVEDAGGWQGDTLTEDLDLSYRAQLRGWRFLYRDDILCPAELPADIRALKNQQHRWAKGAVQTGRKLLPRLWRSAVPFRVKLEGTMHLLNNLAYAALVGVALLLPLSVAARELLELRRLFWFDLLLLVGSTTSVVIFYVEAQRFSRRDWAARLLRIPHMMCLGIGISLNNARGALEGLFGPAGEFRRTAKSGAVDGAACPSSRGRGYLTARWGTAPAEIGLALYMTAAIVLCVRMGWYLSVPFLGLFAAGFAYVGGLGAAGVLRTLATSRGALPSSTAQWRARSG